MQKTIQFLKDKGIIEKIQKQFDKVRPPKGVTEETILQAIEFVLHAEIERDEKLEDEFLDTLFNDVNQNIRKELNIEFVERKSFLQDVLEDIFGKSNVHVHVVCKEEEKKGQGEK